MLATGDQVDWRKVTMAHDSDEIFLGNNDSYGGTERDYYPDGVLSSGSYVRYSLAPAFPVHVAVGYQHSLALEQDGTLWAWGSNDDGQLGDGTTTERHTPVQVQGL